ncbi:hypothetical protein PIB30_053694 [Stylosanthes scabra]|uniref:Helicase ATP-binding domain-containing protein n=1 Tax=Stylosanthes scabra TaxID=79078 RepID=A0ABU6XGS7_9FABA|nr:hypothetical protein [Stylosanthes scabra]
MAVSFRRMALLRRSSHLLLPIPMQHSSPPKVTNSPFSPRHCSSSTRENTSNEEYQRLLARREEPHQAVDLNFHGSKRRFRRASSMSFSEIKQAVDRLYQRYSRREAAAPDLNFHPSTTKTTVPALSSLFSPDSRLSNSKNNINYYTKFYRNRVSFRRRRWRDVDLRFMRRPSGALHRASDECDPESDERPIYKTILEDLSQPITEANVSDGLMSVPLLRHQKIALASMLQKETRSSPCLGGFLADDQGLGKTVSMIALILMQRSLQSKSKTVDACNHKAEALNLDDYDEQVTVDVERLESKEESGDAKPSTEPNSSTRTPSRKKPAGGTLIVCPASILRQWARELKEKVAEEQKLTVLVYHGSNRTKDPIELANYDVVLTTYAIVSNEFPKENDNTDSSVKRASGPLEKVDWFRVILDEAQTIRTIKLRQLKLAAVLVPKQGGAYLGHPFKILLMICIATLGS